MSDIAYFEGQFVDLREAKISIMTHAFLYGTAVFEGIRAYWCADTRQMHIFRPREHFERLVRNSKLLRMQTPFDSDRMVQLAQELVARNAPTQDIYLRPTMYKAGLRIGPALLDNPDDFCMFMVPLGDYIDTQQGISVTVSSWRRVDDNALPPRGKITGSYVNAALAKTDAALSNFADAIVLDDRGHVSEGSAMNLFLVRDGELHTTPITSNILEGITRATLGELARRELGLTVREREIDRSELYVCDEMFFCGTGAQVSPVTSVDHHQVGDGNVGPITAQLRDLYFRVVRGREPSYAHWCVTVSQ